MEQFITSPTLATEPGIVRNPKEFSDALTLDLTDAEITKALQTTLPIREKWSNRFRAKLRHANFTLEEATKMVDEFENELVYELATKCDLVATVDVAPVFEGQPPVIEFVGILSSHPSAKYGLDHELKTWEVKKAKDKNEVFLGVDKL